MKWKSREDFDLAQDIFNNGDDYILNGKVDLDLIMGDYNLSRNKAIYVKKKLEMYIRELNKIDKEYSHLDAKERSVYLNDKE